MSILVAHIGSTACSSDIASNETDNCISDVDPIKSDSSSICKILTINMAQFFTIQSKPQECLYPNRKWLIGKHQGKIGSTSEMINLRSELEATRNKLDEYYRSGEEQSRQLGQILGLFDPFRFFKYQVATTCKAQNVSNSWLNMWELISEFKLVPDSLSMESFVSFHNSALPGHWILALHHYIRTKTSIKSHVWFGLESTGSEDTFSLRSYYPDRWFSVKPNLSEMIQELRSGLIEGVHLYTSDAGLEDGEYESLEEKHSDINKEQIMLGIMALRRGGNMAVKLYTFFTDKTQTLISLCARLFNTVYLSKPQTSKISNTECYLVGLGLIECPTNLEEQLEQISNKTLDVDLIDSAKSIYKNHILCLQQAMKLYQTLSQTENPNDGLRILRNSVRGQYEVITSQWMSNYQIKSLRPKDKIMCVETVNVRQTEAARCK